MALIGNSFANSPDIDGLGLTYAPLNALRYDGQSAHPSEIGGMMHALMPAGVRVLDVGCGTGSVTLLANRNRANTVMAIEPDGQRAEVARSRGITVHVGFLDEDFPVTNGLFDVVMSSDVLEHTARPAELLTLMAHAVKPEGVVLVSVPNVAHWSVRLKLLFGRFDYEPVGIMDATHLRWFTARSIVGLFERCGLRVIEIRQTAGTDLPIYGRGVFRRIPRPIKANAIRLLTRVFPLLFGVQHVVKACVKPEFMPPAS